jgi:hypothetical protein
MSPLLEQVLQQIEQLTPEERLELIRQVAEGLKKSTSIDEQPKTQWSDLKGLAPYPMMGEDAQAWVSRTRREADEHRERVLRGESSGESNAD